MNEPYYTLDTSLFDGQFRYFGSELVQVRGKLHQSEEQYSLRPAEQDIEPITALKGTRQYVHMKPFVLIPDITFTIGLYPQPGPGGAIGEVVGAQERKQREVEIGQAQAWYYSQDHLIVLWECFARCLQEQFPEATRISTPWHDPLFENEEYHEFLRSLGYEQIAKAAYGKSIEQA
jgi:hypothetical protein